MYRVFLPDYDHAAVARHLRRQAMSGFQRGGDEHSGRYVAACTCGVNLREAPNSVSLILTRDAVPGCLIGWHLSICCVSDKGYRGYVPAEGHHWLKVIFRDFADRAVQQPLEDRSLHGHTKDLRHFIIECEWNDRSDPAVNLGVAE